MTVHGGETFDAPAEWLRWYNRDEQDKRAQDNTFLINRGSGKPTEKIGGIPL